MAGRSFAVRSHFDHTGGRQAEAAKTLAAAGRARMIWETIYRVAGRADDLVGIGVWVYRRSWDYFTVNGQWYRNPVYVGLYYSASLEPECWNEPTAPAVSS